MPRRKSTSRRQRKSRIGAMPYSLRSLVRPCSGTRPCTAVGGPTASRPLSSGWRGIDWPQAMLWTCFFRGHAAGRVGRVLDGERLDEALAGDWLWPAPNSARFAPAEPLAPGAYRLAGPAAQLADRAGNGLADSLLALAFTVGAETAAIRGRCRPRKRVASGSRPSTRTGGRTPSGPMRTGGFALNGLLLAPTRCGRL